MIEASFARLKSAPPPPLSSGGECSHDGFGKGFMCFEASGMALRSGGVGGAQPPLFANPMLA